ncbi:peptide-methionine (S)-S-oxide reductase MsrA [Candidatus Woesearchaeota archaeon]|nr:peptide-methionine (S)-S-oxide reductase MsrA [Candidatus Woesearchaeota archaeon]
MIKNLKKAYFAGGCFWCVEAGFRTYQGVKEVFSGYMGGKKANPTYEEVSGGNTGHKEVIEVHYNPDLISYSKLIDIFWTQIDPTDPEGQFSDRGSQYQTAIFYQNKEEQEIAENSKRSLEKTKKFNQAIATKILPATPFWKAEEEHQNYACKNPLRYQFYESASGRKKFKEKVWRK